MASERTRGMQIGRVLKDARVRAGLEIGEIEDRTKIRTLYLRALEDEDWDALPSPAYAKGFLRTYAELLALDAEALVDEFRRQVEGGDESGGYPLGERVLERRRRPGDGPRRPGPLLLAVGAAIAIAAVLAAIGLSGGDDEPADEPRREKDGRGKRDGGSREGKAGGRADSGPVLLELAVREAVEVCLLAGSGRELIDGQVLSAGTRESFEAERMVLRFPSGYSPRAVELSLDGKPVRLARIEGPAAFRIEGRPRLERAPAPGATCP